MIGFFGNFGKAFGFQDNTAGQDGANEVQAFNTAGIKRIDDAFDTTSENLQPFIDEGNVAREGVIQGSTVGGLNDRLRQIFDSEIFNTLNEERGRSVQGQLAATGQSRSGLGLQEAARVPTDLGLMIEQVLADRLGGIANRGFNTAVGLESNRGRNAANSANLLSGIGSATAQGMNIDNQADTAGIHKFSDQQKEILQTSISSAGNFFSDPVLKENAKIIARVADLNFYEWNWKPETKGTIIADYPEAGFMADEVKEKYPQHISEVEGFKVIRMKNLLDELEVAA